MAMQTYNYKYPVKPQNAQGMYSGCAITDIKFIDTSLATILTNTFQNCNKLKHLGTISAESVTGTLTATFSGCTQLVTIEKLIVAQSTKYSGTFANCSSLVNIRIEGLIAQNGFDVSSCVKLSKASIESIITHLIPNKAGLTIKLSKTAVDKAFSTAAGANNGSTSNAWNNLINENCPAWTVTLA